MVTSPKTLDLYQQIDDYPKLAALIFNGVDRTLYHPARAARRETPIVKIGWVGNSLWGDGDGLDDVKGLRSIIRPAVETLHAEGVDIE